MLFIERGGKEQLHDEIKAYNPLVPKGKELVATLMFEIDNPLSRAEFLNKVGGIEEKILNLSELPDKSSDIIFPARVDKAIQSNNLKNDITIQFAYNFTSLCIQECQQSIFFSIFDPAFNHH